MCLPVFLVSCGTKVVGPVDVKPIQAAPVHVEPVRDSVQRTQTTLHDTRLAIASANAEAEHAKSQASKAQGMLSDYTTLVDELEKSNNALFEKFRILGEQYRELELDRASTIQALQANVEEADKKLKEAEEKTQKTLDHVYRLEDEVFASQMELEQYRARDAKLVAAIKATEQKRVDDVNKARAELKKSRDETAKYKGYYDIGTKLMWFVGVLILLGIVLFYIRNFTVIGRVTK